MTRSAEATGKNIEQAIENALFELKAPREDVDIKILSEGGLFKKAKVIVSISEDAIEKYEKREKLREEEKEQKSSQEKISDKEEVFSKDIKKEEEKEIKEKENFKEEKEEIKNSEEKRERISCIEFVKGLVDAFGKTAQISELEEDEVKKILLEGEELGDLIGYRGEALFALSYLMSSICKRENKKVVLDICGYRNKREEALKKLAYRMASKVIKSGRFAKLEPMDASERRIIHLALQDNDKVTTMSKGTEPKRYLIIFPREYKD